jgi:hypothetical protein
LKEQPIVTAVLVMVADHYFQKLYKNQYTHLQKIQLLPKLQLGYSAWIRKKK